MTHSLKEEYEDEWMPDSEQMFIDTLEFKLEALDKVITLDMGAYLGTTEVKSIKYLTVCYFL